MKSLELQKLHRFGLALVVLLVVLAPFHAFLTVFAAKLFGHYTLWRLGPEILLFLLVVVSTLLLWKDGVLRRTILKSRLTWLVLAYVAWLVVMAGWSYLRHHVTKTALADGLILDARLPLFFLTAQVVLARDNWVARNWRKALIWPALAVVVVGLLQIFVLPYGFLQHFGYGPGTIMPFETVDQKLAYVRVQSTLRGANPLGAYLVVVLAGIAGIGFIKRKPWAKVAMVLAGIGTAVVLTFTYSRSAYIGAVLALAAVTWWAITSKRFKQLAAMSAVVVVVVGAVALVALRHNDRFQNTFFHTDSHSTSVQSSNDARGSALKTGAHDALLEPLGRGPGTAGPASAHNTGQPTRISENYFLQIGQEVGWIGLVLFVGIYALLALHLWQRRGEPLARILLASLVGLTVINLLSHAWTDETIAILWWTLAGAAVAPRLKTKE